MGNTTPNGNNNGELVGVLDNHETHTT